MLMQLWLTAQFCLLVTGVAGPQLSQSLSQLVIALLLGAAVAAIVAPAVAHRLAHLLSWPPLLRYVPVEVHTAIHIEPPAAPGTPGTVLARAPSYRMVPFG